MKIIMSIVAIIIVASAILQGINASETVDCKQWAKQAEKYQGFYLTQWQADQCAAHSIIINAPIR